MNLLLKVVKSFKDVHLMYYVRFTRNVHAILFDKIKMLFSNQYLMDIALFIYSFY